MFLKDKVKTNKKLNLKSIKCHGPIPKATRNPLLSLI
jgi:hypothetical protein